MAKNKQSKTSESSKQPQKREKHPSKKKPRWDDKPSQKEHLEQIPFRLREIMKSKDRMKLGSSKKMKKNAFTPKPQAGDKQADDIPVPHFRRGQAESEKAYVRRMSRETEHVLFLTKNQVERQPELEEEQQEKPADKHKSEKRKEFDKVKLQRLHKKKANQREEREEKELYTDDIQFGEVAMAPPSLSSKPRKAPIKSQGAPKGLLLTSLLGQTSVSTAKPSMARQRIMEEERVRVVEAYRHLKKQKQQQQELRAAGMKKLQNLQ